MITSIVSSFFNKGMIWKILQTGKIVFLGHCINKISPHRITRIKLCKIIDISRFLVTYKDLRVNDFNPPPLDHGIHYRHCPDIKTFLSASKISLNRSGYHPKNWTWPTLMVSITSAWIPPVPSSTFALDAAATTTTLFRNHWYAMSLAIWNKIGYNTEQGG